MKVISQPATKYCIIHYQFIGNVSGHETKYYNLKRRGRKNPKEAAKNTKEAAKVKTHLGVHYVCPKHSKAGRYSSRHPTKKLRNRH